MGNPNLKQSLYYNGKLAVAYFKPQSQDYISLQYIPSYYNSTYVSVLSVEGNQAVLRPERTGSLFNNLWQLFARKQIGKWFSLNPYVTYNYKRYDTPSEAVRLSYLRYGGALIYNTPKMSIMASANSPVKDRRGDLTVKSSAQYSFSFIYKYKAWSVGMRWNYAGKGEITKGSIPGFQYREESTWKPMRNMFSLTATWSFSHGRSRQHPSKSLNNSYSDNGLTKFNEPKPAQ